MSDPAAAQPTRPRRPSGPRTRVDREAELPAEVAQLSCPSSTSPTCWCPPTSSSGSAAPPTRTCSASETPSPTPVPANTARAYRADWAAWCQLEGRPALPARPLDLAPYLAKAADMVTTDAAGVPRPAFAISTLCRRIAAISAVHQAHGYAPSPTQDPLVRLTLRGLARRRAREPRGPVRSTARKKPLLLAHLVACSTTGPPRLARRRRPPPRPAAAVRVRRRAGAAPRPPPTPLDDVLVDRDRRTHTPLLLVGLGPDKTDQRHHRVALPRGHRPLTCPLCAYRDCRAGAALTRS